MNENAKSITIDQISVEHLDALKRSLLNASNDSKKDVIRTLTEMLSAYKVALQNNNAKDLPDLPKIILQVDMIHAISQVMATSDAQLFSCTLGLLNSIFEVPLLRGKLSTVVESGLRVASMVAKSDYSVIAEARKFFLIVLADLANVPLSIQRQVIAVYRVLPEWLDHKELLEWTQLLLYCPSLLDTLPLKAYTDFVKVLIGYKHQDNIGCLCLTFLANSLKKLPVKLVRDICIIDNDFLRILNEKIDCLCPEFTENEFAEICCSFEIVNRYVVAMSAFREIPENIHIIKLNLTRLIPYLANYYALSESILSLLIELLRRDLKVDNVIILEETDPNVIAEVLTTIHFIALSVAHKAILLRSQITVWIFLGELFRFSARQPGQALRLFQPELNSWNLITFSALLPPNERLLSHPIEFAKFLFEWVKLLSSQKKSHFRIPSISYQSFNYGSFVGTLNKRIHSEILADPNDPRFQNTFEESQQSATMNSSKIAKEKEEILLQIGRLCDKIADSSIDWDSECTDEPSFHCSEQGENVVSVIDVDTDSSDSEKLDENQEFQVFTVPDSDSDTCSESDLNLIELC